MKLNLCSSTCCVQLDSEVMYDDSFMQSGKSTKKLKHPPSLPRIQTQFYILLFFTLNHHTNGTNFVQSNLKAHYLSN